MSPGNAKAHFTLSRGTRLAAIPGALWNRVLLVFMPQPSQKAPSNVGSSSRVPGHIALAEGVVTRGCPIGLPLTNSAMARRSAVVRRTAMLIIGPVSIAARTRSADMERSASRLGARSLPPLWHEAQVRSYSEEPSDDPS